MSMEKPENLQITPASDIRKLAKARQEGELVKLPSGFVARLRRPNLVPLLREQKIPVDLLEVIEKQANGQFSAKNYDELTKSLDAVDIILMQAFVEPKLVKTEPQEGEIHVDDLTDEDRGAAVTYIQSGAKSFQFFRSQPSGEGSGLDVPKIPEPKAE
jgi:hypothetical protein